MTPEPLSCTEIFDRDCPYFLAIGMTYEQYWYDDPLIVRAFAKADKIKRQQHDFNAWLQGRYIIDAIDCTIGNAFRKSGSEAARYPEKPYLLEELEMTQSELKKEKEKQELLFAEAYMNRMCEAGQNWGKNKKQNPNNIAEEVL